MAMTTTTTATRFPREIATEQTVADPGSAWPWGIRINYVRALGRERRLDSKRRGRRRGGLGRRLRRVGPILRRDVGI